MKIWVIPLVAVGAFAASLGDEPSETQMRAAFERALDLQVRNALEFARESGGDEAVRTIRAGGMDRFEVTAFRKLRCERDELREHVCSFAVEVGLASGPLQQTVSGRFLRRDDGLVFAGDG